MNREKKFYYQYDFSKLAAGFLSILFSYLFGTYIRSVKCILYLIGKFTSRAGLLYPLAFLLINGLPSNLEQNNYSCSRKKLII